MRRDHRPFWMRRLALNYERWWMKRFLAPQFDALGVGALIVNPKHVELFGRGISAGRFLHVLASPDLPVRLTTWPAPDDTARIDIGDCVLLTGGVRVMAAKEVTIGDGAMLARGVVVSDCDWHGLYDRVTAVQQPGPVHIGVNAWLGDGCFVGKGVTIGDNAVVGARAVVVHDVPANTVVAGNPAKPVKELDPDAARVTRMDLYQDPTALAKFFDDAWLREHGHNTILNWARASVAPNRED